MKYQPPEIRCGLCGGTFTVIDRRVPVAKDTVVHGDCARHAHAFAAMPANKRRARAHIMAAAGVARPWERSPGNGTAA